MSKIYIIMGKSATGKDTIFKKLVEREELALHTVIPYTTRPIRREETEGVEYFFVSENRLLELEAQGKIIEQRSYDTIHGIWHYFTVEDGQIDLSDANYLLRGTFESYEQIQKFYGKEKVEPLYIDVEDGVRLRRALSREQKQKPPKYAEMCRRYLADDEDFSEQNLGALGIVKKYNNIDINICLQEIVDHIKEKTSR
jgi:guanylate kinase